MTTPCSVIAARPLDTSRMTCASSLLRSAGSPCGGRLCGRTQGLMSASFTVYDEKWTAAGNGLQPTGASARLASVRRPRPLTRHRRTQPAAPGRAAGPALSPCLLAHAPLGSSAMLAPEIAPGDWDVLVSPWHLNEKIEAFPGVGGAAPITRPSYPGSSELSSLVDRCRDIADAVGGSHRPLLLSGDCLAALGMVTGLQRRYGELTVVWLDAHGDFNNPAISTSGYLAGMSLAMVTGRAPEVISGPLGLRPVPDERALLIGARDLDDAERDALKASRVRRAVPDPAAVRAALEDAHPGSVYIHLDIDIVDGNDLPAPLRWETSAGPSIAAVEDCLAHIVDYSRPVGACMACPWPAERIGEPAVARTIGRLVRAMGAVL